METKIDCPCKRIKCERHGHCDECRAHHLKKNHLPRCERIRVKKKR